MAKLADAKLTQARSTRGVLVIPVGGKHRPTTDVTSLAICLGSLIWREARFETR
jgi:hypothetical protein